MQQRCCSCPHRPKLGEQHYYYQHVHNYAEQHRSAGCQSGGDVWAAAAASGGVAAPPAGVLATAVAPVAVMQGAVSSKERCRLHWQEQGRATGKCPSAPPTHRPAAAPRRPVRAARPAACPAAAGAARAPPRAPPPPPPQLPPLARAYRRLLEAPARDGDSVGDREDGGVGGGSCDAPHPPAGAPT